MIWFLPVSCLSIGGIGLLAYEFNQQMVKDPITFYVLVIMVIASIPLFIAAILYGKYKQNKWKNYLWDKLMNDNDFYGHCLDCWTNKMGAAFGTRDDYYVVPTELIEKAIEERELFLPKQVKSVEEGYFNTMFG
jgi:hypothetical protein